MSQFNSEIFVFEDFLFPESCDFLIKEFSKTTKDTARKFVKGGPGADERTNAHTISGLQKILEQSDSKEYNIAIDFLTSLCSNIEKSVSSIFKKDLVLRSYFYTHMTTGATGKLHIDNNSEEYENDFSAILYLSDSYLGGELYFPEKEKSIKPKAGTLITFIGDKSMKHEIKEILSGDRINIVCFLKERGVK